ncbi:MULTISPECIES: metallophosphoesterase family protein [unclassified Microbacterium]|uniref:metallophosphoesterase family protein n=1 Tax=unclassified Microbacterium TaxID=2609290 RepID=UPI00109CD2AF|nr:metallophosphoesterase [Microbacterium sp. K41]
MRALERASTIDLPDQRVAVCGDWHGNVGWVRTLSRILPALAPDVTTILQLGDWWIDPDAVDEALADTNIDRIYVTLGNHEPWSDVTPLLDEQRSSAVRVSKLTWLLARPARLTIGGRSVLSLGGAASVDRLWRREGTGWWPDERISDENVAAAIGGGPADLMLTHESPARTPVRAVQEVLRSNPMGFPDETLAESAQSRERVAKVWDAIRPGLLMHGHMHVAGGGATDDGRRVASFGRDTMQGSLAFLDLRTLRLEVPTVQQMREAAFPVG